MIKKVNAETPVAIRHALLCATTRLAVIERHMTGKTVGELIKSGEWAKEIFAVDLLPGESPYNPDCYVVHVGRRKPGNNITQTEVDVLAREHLAQAPLAQRIHVFGATHV